MAKSGKESDYEKVKFSAFCVQFLAAIIINSLTGLAGFVFAWPSYTIAHLVSNQTELSRPLTTLEVSMLGSLPNIGALILVPFCGYTIDTIGRKYSAIIFGIPYVLSWLIISVSEAVPAVLCAAALAGVSCAGQVVTPVFITELAQDRVRGALNALNVTQFYLGLMFSYWLGGWLSYRRVVYVHAALSVTYVAAVSCLAESPIFLLQRGKDKEAAVSIAFYRRLDKNSNEVKRITLQMKNQLDATSSPTHTDGEADVTNTLMNPSPENTPRKRVSSWQFIKKSKCTQRALCVVLSVMALSMLMGSTVLQVFAEPLFQQAVPSMPSNLCSIMLAAVSLLASLVCTAVIDVIGRKRLILVSCALTVLSSSALAALLWAPQAPRWLTASLIYFYCFVYNAGAASAPCVIAAEVFLPVVRGFCNSLVMACVCLTGSVTAFSFQYVVAWGGLAAAVASFSVAGMALVGVTARWLPETRGLPSHQIQLLFADQDT